MDRRIQALTHTHSHTGSIQAHILSPLKQGTKNSLIYLFLFFRERTASPDPGVTVLSAGSCFGDCDGPCYSHDSWTALVDYEEEKENRRHGQFGYGHCHV